MESYGRGGAGNMSKNAQQPVTQEDFTTPTIKQDNYTTGRGGTGNMAKNDPARPELARAAQDVEGPVYHKDNDGPIRFGRGGAANVIHKDGDLKVPGATNRAPGATKERRLSETLADRGKGMLNKLMGGEKK
ncbi:hypothetical protein LTS18_012400 [Coniosporium uncinatum]|uniref:Uncharacterized protein n=1 Tax=Coniosporium uncinatum TaxID=93489 RepID=A0ACC3D9D0_9PEZI|nr:hypothetical protein LTS18_012400 [Coniosporium uncinatum]